MILVINGLIWAFHRATTHAVHFLLFLLRGWFAVRSDYLGDVSTYRLALHAVCMATIVWHGGRWWSISLLTVDISGWFLTYYLCTLPESKPEPDRQLKLHNA